MAVNSLRAETKALAGGASEIVYPESDGKPMAETGIHVKIIAFLLVMLRSFFHRRDDVYVSGDMFLYFEEGNPNRKVAPDLFVVFGSPKHERRSWFTWKEGKNPDVVFEFTSKSTQDEDRWTKRGLYEWLGVQEYFLFDPLDEYLRPRLQGYRLVEGVYQPIPLVNGQLQSEMLGLTIAVDGEMLTLTVTATGERLLPPNELIEAYRAEIESRRKAEVEVERLRAELDRLKGLLRE